MQDHDIEHKQRPAAQPASTQGPGESAAAQAPAGPAYPPSGPASDSHTAGYMDLFSSLTEGGGKARPAAGPPEAPKGGGGLGTVTVMTGGGNLNVRQQPNMQGAVLGKLHNGAQIEAIEDVGGWLKVPYHGGVGYVFG